MIEMFKTKVNINPPFMKEILCERTVAYNLRNDNEFLVVVVVVVIRIQTFEICKRTFALRI